VFVGGIRRSIGVVLLGIVPFILFGASQAWAADQQSAGQAESSFTANIAQERSARGLQPLATAADLVALARQHSVDMASAGHPYHDPDIASKVQNWQVMGDNVGSGPDEAHIHDGFMNSKIHRDEILYPGYTEVGVGCYWAGNVLYVTEIFRLPMTVRSSTAPAPRAAPATRVVTRTVRPAPVPAPTAPRATAAPTPPTPTTTTAPTTTAPPAPTEPAPPVSVLAVHTARVAGPGTPPALAALIAGLLLAAVAAMLAGAVRQQA
jgi:hypothetical protein